MVSRGTFYNLLAITLLLAGIAYYISGIPRQQMEQGRWVAHTHEVLNQLSTLTVELSELHADHNHIVSTIQQNIDTLKHLTQDNPVQQARIEPLRQTIAARLADPAQSHTKDVAIIQRIDSMRAEEERLLKEREDTWQASRVHSQQLLLSAVAVVYLFILFAYNLARREARIREQLLNIESQTAAAQQSVAAHMAQIVEMQQDIANQRLDMQNAMKMITQRTQHITHADGTVIEMLEGDEMVYVAASGTMEPYIGLRLKVLGSMSGLCISSGAALHCDDSETDSRVDKAACRKVGLRSMIVVPLVYKEEIVGVLKVAASRVHAFTVDDMQTLHMMAGVLSATLRNALASKALLDSNITLNLTNQILEQQKSQLESDKMELQNRADTDGMTGLKNHRYFQECATQEYVRAQRYGNPLSILMCDIDYFKQFNDRFGHPAGDTVIKQVAEFLKAHTRPSDCVARYGGEEFAIILMQTNISGAVTVAERIRESVHNATWQHGTVTISIGISSLENEATDISALIEQADKALYASKMQGRDKVTAFAA